MVHLMEQAVQVLAVMVLILHQLHQVLYIQVQVAAVQMLQILHQALAVAVLLSSHTLAHKYLMVV